MARVEGMASKKCCPCCSSMEIDDFLTRKGVPVHQNLVLRSRKQALEVTRGNLELAVCQSCGFIFNGAFDAGKMEYGADYDNLQICSGMFSGYIDELARSIVQGAGIQDSRIVEVGCGKGFFLKKLLTIKGGEKNMGYGFDPSYEGDDFDLDGRLHYFRKFYGSDCTNIHADAVVCRHVIEHHPSPIELLKSIRHTLEGAGKARVFFETPCATWILRNNAIWDFFYEHCSLFTAESLSSAFELAGFTVEKVKHVFGGQYLWLEARPCEEGHSMKRSARETFELAHIFAQKEAQFKRAWREKINGLKLSGKVALWGAGAKGVTFANLVDSGGTLIDCIVDINPNKQNGFLPGTGHPIVDPMEVKNRAIEYVILMNPNYWDEVRGSLDHLRSGVNLIACEGR